MEDLDLDLIEEGDGTISWNDKGKRRIAIPHPNHKLCVRATKVRLSTALTGLEKTELRVPVALQTIRGRAALKDLSVSIIGNEESTRSWVGFTIVELQPKHEPDVVARAGERVQINAYLTYSSGDAEAGDGPGWHLSMYVRSEVFDYIQRAIREERAKRLYMVLDFPDLVAEADYAPPSVRVHWLARPGTHFGALVEGSVLEIGVDERMIVFEGDSACAGTASDIIDK